MKKILYSFILLFAVTSLAMEVEETVYYQETPNWITYTQGDLSVTYNKKTDSYGIRNKAGTGAQPVYEDIVEDLIVLPDGSVISSPATTESEKEFKRLENLYDAQQYSISKTQKQ